MDPIMSEPKRMHGAGFLSLLIMVVSIAPLFFVHFDTADSLHNDKGFHPVSTLNTEKARSLSGSNMDIGEQVVEETTAGAEKTPTSAKEASKPMAATVHIDRIYYINLDKNHGRRGKMEAWLKDQPIPYQRISARRGEENATCVGKEGKNRFRPRCRGIAGLITSNLSIMDHHNTTGTTLVLEDDYEVRDMQLLRESIKLVPPDFDIVRWGCWGKRPAEFRYVNENVFRTACIDEATGGEVKCSTRFCGGTHAVLWRGDEASLGKIRSIWAKEPFADIDCLLNTAELNSYCIESNLSEMIGGFIDRGDERTDIPTAGPFYSFIRSLVINRGDEGSDIPKAGRIY